MAAAFLAAMMLLTVADVALRAAFNLPLRGVYELVELLLAATFFVALPAVFLRDENIVVNSIDDMAPAGCRRSSAFALLLSVMVLAVMAWQGFFAARDTFEFHDVTADFGLPRVWHWVAGADRHHRLGHRGACHGVAPHGSGPSRQARSRDSHERRRHRRARRRRCCWC